MRRLLLAVAALVAVSFGTGCAEEGAAPPPEVDRVLIVSVPGVTWDDVEAGEMPNLRRFADAAAVGDLATRIGRRDASLADAYLTIGAGSRAVAPLHEAGVALDAEERYGGAPAADLVRRRLGRDPEGVAYLAIGAALDTNDRSDFGAELGTLGDELERAGVSRSVIANGDGAEGPINAVPASEEEAEAEPPPDDRYGRAAAAVLMGSDGIVPGGAVGQDLLTADAASAFGHRLDGDRVLQVFDEVWRNPADRSVVLIEASDLVRAQAYRGYATAAQRRQIRDGALRNADALLGRLLTRVDGERDAVVVVSPVAPAGAPALAVAALRSPGVEAGLLRSASTRRDGYVELADVAPTVLSLLGETSPARIDGRPFRVARADGADRLDHLADAAEAARRRDRLVAPVVLTFVAVLAVLAAATLARRRLPGRARAAVPPVALAVVGAVTATFVVGSIDVLARHAGLFAASVVVLGAATAWLGMVAEGRRPGGGPIVAVGLLVLVVVADVLFGAPLQVNTVFGYSVAVAGRFAGLGNLAYALLGSAAVVLGALLAERSGRRGVALAVAVLGVVVLVDGLPMLGADVGGLLSMVPAFGLTALILAGRDVRPRHLAALAVAALAALLLFAFVDLARPSDSRTHLARLARHVLDGRWGPFFDTVARRWEASFGGAELAAWATIGLVVLGVGTYVGLVVARRVGPRATPTTPRPVPVTAAAAGLGLLAMLGLVVNDSSFAVPGMMLLVVVPVVVFRANRVPAPGPVGP